MENKIVITLIIASVWILIAIYYWYTKIIIKNKSIDNIIILSIFLFIINLILGYLIIT